MKLLVAGAFLILGIAAYSRSSTVRQVTAQELLSSNTSGSYVIQGEIVSQNESGIILRGADNVEVRLFGTTKDLTPGASGSLVVQRTGDSLSVTKFVPNVEKSDSGSLEGLRYNPATNTLYGQVRTSSSLGWVNVNKNGIYAVQK